ncbi:o-succinylbenzoate--CoA ligase [Solibacillus isronensis]|uniref:o-succinylbenzoate--CoA ligase n=1 Tax=Solibacillus isronensis TaxID=412383 RepID=UPI0009A5DC60|nr:o-succinylbenzoate--CoA ligase [Solibacillus isronensis]
MQPNWIKQRAYLTPNRVALSFHDEQWTFKELYLKSVSLAYKLNSLRLTNGKRVAILAPSTPPLIELLYACMQAQCEMVLLNGRLAKQELAYQVEDAEVDAILVADEELAKLPDDARIIPFSKLYETAESEYEIAAQWEEDFALTIMYTSGTTGFPKGVCQTVSNHSSSAISSALNLGISEKDTWLCTVPIFHISGFSIVVRSLLYGMKIRLYEKFDAKKCAQEIMEGTVTKMSVVSVILENILSEMEQAGQKAHPHFTTALAGGGPVPVDYLKRAEKLDLRVAQTYGMTETSSQTATLANEDAMTHIGSAGKPLFFNEIKIDAKDGESIGEILIRGPHVTPKYIGRFNDKPTTINGWLHTGDVGYLDEQGYLYVVDRRSDLIISGGENIYPAEIENILLGHPNIKEAGVCGIEHDKWGQVPVAFIVAKKQMTEQEITDFCTHHLANYKVPKQVHFVSHLPRSGSNKLLRRKLMQLLEE